jgi:hypothetical protein
MARVTRVLKFSLSHTSYQIKVRFKIQIQNSSQRKRLRILKMKFSEYETKKISGSQPFLRVLRALKMTKRIFLQIETRFYNFTFV